MKNKIIFIIAYFLIHSPIQAMNPENKQVLRAYKDFLNNINIFLSHPEDPKNYCFYLKKAQEDATFLMSNLNPILKEDTIYKKEIDNFLDTTFPLLCSNPHEIFLNGLTIRLLTNIKTLKQNIQDPHMSDIQDIEKKLSRYKKSHINIDESVIFWKNIQNSLRQIYPQEKPTPIAIKTLLAIDIKKLAKDPTLYNFLNQIKTAMSLLYFNKYPSQFCSFLTSALSSKKLASQHSKNDALIYLQILKNKIMKTQQNESLQKVINILDDIKTKILNNKFTTQDHDFIIALCNQISNKQDQAFKKESFSQKTALTFQSKISLTQRVKNFFKSVGDTATSVKNRIVNFFRRES